VRAIILCLIPTIANGSSLLIGDPTIVETTSVELHPGGAEIGWHLNDWLQLKGERDDPNTKAGIKLRLASGWAVAAFSPNLTVQDVTYATSVSLPIWVSKQVGDTKVTAGVGAGVRQNNVGGVAVEHNVNESINVGAEVFRVENESWCNGSVTIGLSECSCLTVGVGVSDAEKVGSISYSLTY
jgi:hypothetical protein